MKNITYFIIAFSFSCNTLIAQNNPIIKLDLQTKNSVIDNICKALNKNYVFPDKAKLMSDFIKEQNTKGKYDLLTNPNELADTKYLKTFVLYLTIIILELHMTHNLKKIF